MPGLAPERLEAYFRTQKFVALTESTVTDPRKLRPLIEECRKAGYSAVEDELAYGVVAVAVPVHDQYGRVVAALNSSSHSRKITKTKIVRERLAMLQPGEPRDFGRARARARPLALRPGLTAPAAPLDAPARRP